ncbi:dihydrolipoyllysine-residue acetyltransferase component of acetoin cleaving system [Desulfosarcina ovata subsp. sediminis]|uniref:Dihydrolipoyllysine-residue acetyltransferase component of acetoin cleaving system n=1 Tax=Desulfosarcina ovata subsp. sediminis TaxID=885957 RepID=A0A5K7ZNB4_9BACT|nr:dihydrolipoyllysine-residue acetyltransferase component of acetoin cleaving system [Desulfosarcina ovata subsp. sediminis]
MILETEKVAHELVAPSAGILAVFGKAGEEYLCGTVVGAVAETKDEYEAIKKDPAKFLAEQGTVPIEMLDEAESAAASPEAENAAPASELTAGDQGGSERIRISPLARNLAKEQGVVLSTVKGSGPGGRIIKRDIEAAIALGRQKAPDAAARVPQTASPAAAADAERVAGKRVLETIPFTGMRKSIADNLHHSLSSSARVTVMFELDVTDLMEFRSYYANQAGTLGFKVTYTDLFVLMVSRCLKAIPIMNSSIVGNEIKIWKDINIGFAVAVKRSETESGLVVPVIKNTEQMSLGDIAKARIALMEKARSNTLAMDEISGGTFTLTNTGALSSAGWQIQTPIMSPGEAVVLGTGTIVDRPVVKNRAIVIGSIMPMSLSFDHRIMDGIPPGQFMDKLTQMATEPQMILI